VLKGDPLTATAERRPHSASRHLAAKTVDDLPIVGGIYEKTIKKTWWNRAVTADSQKPATISHDGLPVTLVAGRGFEPLTFRL
jgi:hypothetical protein